ncbi:heparinase II/III family protein [Gillisia sp. CAL575]|uniref:heparinase II/III family protein n=1 Tax=Gillisia sp. CAL575 TaxID=985255 RepID=UPI000686FB64|nr:heparinase II/III family protein [Gillisia sp. CAL575]
MSVIKIFLPFCFLAMTTGIHAQDFPSERVIPNNELVTYLKPEVKNALADENGVISNATLATYFREKFSERYFYDWKNFDERFKTHNNLYPSSEGHHNERALDHLSKYPGDAKWKLPFNYLTGEAVDAYALRHLARQHKMVDIAFYYNYKQKDTTYLNYFTSQLQSLNQALDANKFETIDDGNGVYEVFRSGYRILNWLQIHNMFLGEKQYSDEDQLRTIATLLQHGANLFENNQEFSSGNHQTRGMSALAMLSILLRDFEGTDKWYERSMDLLEQHLSAEINKDGFQFERTVHYHMSDIKNYFYVYQLAKNSGINVGPVWEEKLKSLFITLEKIAFPDGSAPVFSDDTDKPWAERNDISGAMTLGYLLFNDPGMGFFASNKVESDTYWYLSGNQLGMLENIKTKQPDFKSLAFTETGYYIMRNGWEAKDKMLVISAGLDDKKPDHQHGDILGIQAMANGKVILPNYQVRYSLDDLELFKNSLVKNVALVDDELQGKDYKSNKGGSGFGKFGELPQPNTIVFKSNPDLDLYIGSHNGFENIEVEYSRQVIFVKDDFWIIKDNFNAEKDHIYKQIWQGHYTAEHAPNLLRSTFDDGSGLDILQLESADTVVSSGQRGKQWSIVSSKPEANFNFITILYPFEVFDARINEDEKTPDLKGWQLNLETQWELKGEDLKSLIKDNMGFLFSVSSLKIENIQIDISASSDIYLKKTDSKILVQSLSVKPFKISFSSITKSKKVNKKEVELQPGEKFEIDLLKL